MQNQGYKYLTAQIVERLRGASLSVRRPMTGNRQGIHKSPAFGSSVEFAEYRRYYPGDPVGRIDWPVYARSDRYVIRQFHEDVSIRCFVLLDISESMNFRQTGRISKIDYACFVAAQIMYIITHQGDTASLMTFDSDIRKHFDPAGSFTGLRPMLLALEQIKPERKGDIAASLHRAAEMIPGKVLIVLISDLLQEPEKIIPALTHLHHTGKDITVFHVLDPAEINTPDAGLVEIVSLETKEKITVDWAQIRSGYEAQVQKYFNELRTGCQNIRADYIIADTKTAPYDLVLKRSRSL